MFYSGNGFHNGIQTHFMGSMWIGEVTGGSKFDAVGFPR
jgi:hypothetical protein